MNVSVYAYNRQKKVLRLELPLKTVVEAGIRSLEFMLGAPLEIGESGGHGRGRRDPPGRR